jgi:pullulanase/glycogen debranching enzyme
MELRGWRDRRPRSCTAAPGQIKNFSAILMLSQGEPMILSGDECRRSQSGDNNGHCEDNASVTSYLAGVAFQRCG